MSISANPLERVASTPILGELFNALGINRGPDPIILKSGSDAGNDNATEGADRYNFTPGARSLKARVMTLIENNKPGVALDILQSKIASVPEDVEAIADDVLCALKESGFEKDAREFQIILASTELEDLKPKANTEQVLGALTHG